MVIGGHQIVEFAALIQIFDRFSIFIPVCYEKPLLIFW